MPTGCDSATIEASSRECAYMTSISRRGFVLSAAAAGAAFGLDGPLAFIGEAQAQRATPKGPALHPIGAPQRLVDQGFAKFKVGSVEVIQVYDGHWEKAHDAAFIKDVSVDETKAALKKGGATDAFVPIPFTVTFIRSGGKTIMFDSSTGGQLAPTAGAMMARNMYRAGIEPRQISTIVVTHFHPDHIWGLMGKETNAQVFPDAEIIVPEVEYKFWTDPALIEKLPEARRGMVRRIQATMPKWKNLKQVAAGKDAIAGVRAIGTHGHTPGHTSYRVTSGRQSMIVSGDVTNMPALNMRNPGWYLSFDHDAATAETNRRTFMEMAIKEKSIITGYHWGLPGAGTIKKDGKGYALVPVKV